MKAVNKSLIARFVQKIHMNFNWMNGSNRNQSQNQTTRKKDVYDKSRCFSFAKRCLESKSNEAMHRRNKKKHAEFKIIIESVEKSHLSLCQTKSNTITTLKSTKMMKRNKTWNSHQRACAPSAQQIREINRVVFFRLVCSFICWFRSIRWHVKEWESMKTMTFAVKQNKDNIIT